MIRPTHIAIALFAAAAYAEPAQAQVSPGDMNCDGVVNGLDVPLFVDCAVNGNCDHCPNTGACCFASGACSVLPEDECLTLGGVSWTFGEECYPHPCVSLNAMVPIPGGDFEMGDHHDESPWALPLHAVHLDTYYMDVVEVTNQQYVNALNWAYAQGLIHNPVFHAGRVHDTLTSTYYCATTAADPDSRITWDGSTFGVTGQDLHPEDPGNKTNHPVICVNWFGAAAYANWRSIMTDLPVCYDSVTWECDFGMPGYRLPTEAEWEYAARGGGAPYYRYPWGDIIDGSKANYAGSGDPFELEDSPYTTPVAYYDGDQTPPGSDMANAFGLYDMAGNVWEWCHDWYGPYEHCDPPPCDNPHGPEESPDGRVLRSGSWNFLGGDIQCYVRDMNNPYAMSNRFGFRLVLKTE